MRRNVRPPPQWGHKQPHTRSAQPSTTGQTTLTQVHPPPWWDQAPTSIPSSPLATKSDHIPATVAALLLTSLSLVLLPPTIPHHSNNSPPSLCYTTPSHHFAPPLYSGAHDQLSPRATPPSIQTTHPSRWQPFSPTSALFSCRQPFLTIPTIHLPAPATSEI